jgi:hypothetical protein
MEKMSAQRSPSMVPLARDPEGNIIELPGGAVGWRVRRQTGGRPRLHLDAKKQPMVLALEYTLADVEDILPPGGYLLDVVDKNGQPLDVTVAIAIGQLRNAESVEPDEAMPPVAVPTTLPATTSDVRLVLEANVRATQMAFLHNQRTLELSLRMAETLRDGVQVLASSQADWIKSVAAARGFHRGGAQQLLPPVEVKQLTVNAGSEETHDEEEDDVEDAGEAQPPSWLEQYGPLLNQVAQQVLPAITAWLARQNHRADDSGTGDSGPKMELADLLNWGRMSRKVQAHKAKRAEGAKKKTTTATPTSAPPARPGGNGDLFTLLQSLPVDVRAKLMEVRSLLAPDEQAEALEILANFDGPTLGQLMEMFETESAELCAATMRNLIADWRRLKAGGAASGTQASTGAAPGEATPAAASTKPPKGPSGSTEPR